MRLRQEKLGWNREVTLIGYRGTAIEVMSIKIDGIGAVTSIPSIYLFPGGSHLGNVAFDSVFQSFWQLRKR